MYKMGVQKVVAIGADGLPMTTQPLLSTNTVTPHDDVTFAAEEWKSSDYFPCEGYRTLNIVLVGDGLAANQASLQWSYDGTTDAFQQFPIGSGTGEVRTGQLTVVAPYFRLTVNNGDTLGPHDFTTRVYMTT